MSDYTFAKNAGLNHQALVIEEAETEIKQATASHFTNLTAIFHLKREISKIIKTAILQLELDKLKETAEIGLVQFANRIYAQMKLDLAFVSIAILASVKKLNTPSKYTNNELEKAFSSISRNTTALNATAVSSDTIRNWKKARAYDTGVPLKRFMKDYMKDVERAYTNLAKSTAKEDYSTNISLRNIAEMQVREQKHIDELVKLANDGDNIVWTSTHGNCSERCERWQGKLYSLDNTYGSIDGIAYQPLENATDIFQTTKSGKTYKNSIISGFNCRHFLIPYKQGNKPIHISAKDIQRDRDINTQQRYLERGVREYKNLALMFRNIDRDKYIHYRNKARQWNEGYISYSIKNKVAYYPSRTKIFDSEFST